MDLYLQTIIFSGRGITMRRKIRPIALSTKKIFYIGLILLVGLTIIQLPVYNGKAFFTLLHSDVNDSFMDFFNSIFDASFSNPYIERGVIYPPLAYVFYNLCALLLPEGKTALEWRNSQQGIVLISIVTILNIVLLHCVLMPDNKKNDPQVRRMLWWILLGTVPFWYAMERGNLVLLTLLFLTYFVKNYQSENEVKKELALLSLAISVSFKVYPVFFGLLLLRNKQYKEAIRCVIYGLLTFLIPFFFYGGINNITILVANLTKTSGRMGLRGWGYKVNIENTINFLAEAFHVDLDWTTTIVKLICVVLVAGIFFLSKKTWQQYMALTSIMMLFPGFSYTYTLIFATIPLVAFLMDNPQGSTINLMFSILFLGMFAPFPFDGAQLFDAAPSYKYNLNLTTVISSLSLILMVMLTFLDVIYNFLGKTSKEIQIVYIGRIKITNASLRFLIITCVIMFVAVICYLYCNQLYNISFSF